jgi:hypothetical protein
MSGALAARSSATLQRLTVDRPMRSRRGWMPWSRHQRATLPGLRPSHHAASVVVRVWRGLRIPRSWLSDSYGTAPLPSNTVVVASFVIAVVGLVLAVADLVWQFASYSLSGGRVKVEFLGGAMHAGGRGVLTMPAGKLNAEKMQQAAKDGFVLPIMGVRVRNVGRMAVTVAKWEIVATSGLAFNPVGSSIGKPLPHQLDAGQSEMWVVDATMIQDLVNASREVLKVSRVTLTGRVELAAGRSVTGADRLAA